MATLSTPVRRRGEVLWVPMEAVILAARERYGKYRVRWQADALTLTVAPLPALGHQVRTVRVGVHPDRVRVVLEAAAPLDWSVLAEGDGRLVVALPGSALGPGIASRQFNGGLLRAIEPVQGPSGARVHVRFAGYAEQARWFSLPDPFRIVVDLYRVPLGEAAVARGPETGPGGSRVPPAAKTAGAPPPSPEAQGDRPARASAQPSARDASVALAPAHDPAVPAARSRTAPPALPEAPPDPEPPSQATGPAHRGPLTIVIDPGHGGKDTGAIGPQGLREKDVVLDIGLRLRQLLVERLGAKVIMTRSDDTFVSLEERTAVANRARGDFFISIHVNSAPKPRASGVETYYLSREPSDGDARASAARENLVLNLEGIGPREQDSLRVVLSDMAETLQVKESSVLAELLLERLAQGLRVETRGVKHGPFVVLMTAGMPSVLVEVAFISNPHAERRLQGEGYRQQVAAALFEGIGRFAHRYQRRLGMLPARQGPS